MKALPVVFYRDPELAVDEIRRLHDLAKRQAERVRRNKSLRIKALVAEVMKRGGGYGK